MNIKCTIDWIRHGESCSNLYKNHTNDKLNKQYVNDLVNYQPNLSYIGMQQAILLSKNINISYDAIVCSATVRSIMTALLAFRHYPNKTIYVVPYISEIMKHPETNYHDLPVPSIILKRIILFIKDWLQYSWPTHYDDLEYLNEKNNKIYKNIPGFRGPIVDFTLLDKYENNYVDLGSVRRMEKFYNIIIPELYNKISVMDPQNLLKNNLKICCIIHGDLMKLHFKYLHNVYNTQIFTEFVTIYLNTNKYIREKMIYGSIPKSIRKMYPDLENNNMDVCSINNIKGFINIPLWDINNEYNINVTPDIQYFINGKMYLKYYNINGNIIG